MWEQEEMSLTRIEESREMNPGRVTISPPSHHQGESTVLYSVLTAYPEVSTTLYPILCMEEETEAQRGHRVIA